MTKNIFRKCTCFMFKIFSQDGRTILAETACPAGCFDTNKNQWTEMGMVFNRHTVTQAKQIKHTEEHLIKPQNYSYFISQCMKKGKQYEIS